MSLAPIPEALDALRAGRPIIVADDENRENEGDVVLSAELATPEAVAWTIRWSSGLLCAPMPAEWADRLDLPPMVAVNEDARGTAYTVTVDAADRTSTGISASDRAHTLNVLADPDSTPSSVIRPGHVLPLRAVDGRVLPVEVHKAKRYAAASAGRSSAATGQRFSNEVAGVAAEPSARA